MDEKGWKIKRFCELKKQDPQNEMFGSGEGNLESQIKKLEREIEDLDE